MKTEPNMKTEHLLIKYTYEDKTPEQLSQETIVGSLAALAMLGLSGFAIFWSESRLSKARAATKEEQARLVKPEKGKKANVLKDD